MEKLTWAAIKARCVAAGTVDKARKDVGDEYAVVKTKTIHDLIEKAGFVAFDCLQGPSIKPAHEPFARHMIVYRPAGDAWPVVPSFVIVMTNSHDGLTPIMLAPGVYDPTTKGLLWAAGYAVFHRLFTEEGKHIEPIKEAIAKAIAAQADTLAIWNKAQRFSLDKQTALRFAAAIIGRHTGGARIPQGEVLAFMERNAMPLTAANVALGFVAGFVGGFLRSKTGSGNWRKSYPSRAVVRFERPGFGAWAELVALLAKAKAKLPDLKPFSVSPVPRSKGKGRRLSGSVTLTDKAATANV